MSAEGASGGRALLVVGHAPGATFQPSELRELARAAQVLLASERPWVVRRLSPVASPAQRPTRLNLKRAIKGLGEATEPALLFVFSGVIRGGQEPGLVTGEMEDDLLEESALSLDWITEALTQRRTPPLLVVLEVERVEGGHADAAALASRLAQGGGPVAVACAIRDQGVERANRLVNVVFEGLRAPASGEPPDEVTFRSLIEHVSRSGAATSLGIEGDIDVPLLVAAPWILDLPGISEGPVRPSSVEPAPDLEGEMLPGRVVIDGLLGHGGFGSVYLGRQLTMDRPVAVKILKPDLGGDPDERRRFAREARILARLRHPNVVAIYQADVTRRGEVFFTMELLTGGTLQAELERTPDPWPEDDAVRVFRDIVSGLSAAHACGIIHGDLKPVNIGFREVGAGSTSRQAVLLDFGVSQLVQGRDSGIGGTIRYMAPEQLDGRAILPASDVFTAALIFYELLTGTHTRQARHPLPVRLPASISDRWAGLLQKALAKQPSERPADAQALLALVDEGSPLPLRTTPFRFSGHRRQDAWRFAGRDNEVERLLSLVAFEPLTVLTGPSGVGKTSLVQAGLLPRLDEIGIAYQVYASSDPDQLIDALRAPVKSAREVVVLDQLERLLRRSTTLLEPFFEALGDTPSQRNLLLVLREEELGRWYAGAGSLAELAASFRLERLHRAAARAALSASLRAQGMRTTEEALEDLTSALDAFDEGTGVQPSHLQMVAAALWEATRSTDAPVTGAEARALGGVEGILRGHLARTLDRELDPEGQRAARQILLELVGPSGQRESRTRDELVGRYVDAAADAAFDLLTRRGLVVPSLGDPSRWELAHDTLLEPVLSWCDVRDLERRRAIEVVRFHVHRSTATRPSLLRSSELDDVLRSPEALEELDARWSRGIYGDPRDIPRPSIVVAKSRARRRLRRAGAIALTGAVLITTTGLGLRYARDRELRAGDIGRFELRVEAFDLDPERRPIPVEAHRLSGFRFRLRQPSDPLSVDLGPLASEQPRATETEAGTFIVEAKGGLWTLEVDGRHREGAKRCPPSVLHDVRLPGYSSRAQDLHRTLRIPTCKASREGTVEIPRGPYISGETNVPSGEEHFPVRQFYLDTYAIDEAEISFRDLRTYLEGIRDLAARPGTPPERKPIPDHPFFGQDEHPAGNLSWEDARNLCSYFGKHLPTFAQAEKAARGGFCLVHLNPDGSCSKPNPNPHRPYFWGDEDPEDVAGTKVAWDPKLRRDRSSLPVRTPGFESPYGVLHLAGNAFEWLADGAREDRPPSGTRNPFQGDGRPEKYIYGGYYRSRFKESLRAGYADRLYAGNLRFMVGLRCASRPRDPELGAPNNGSD